MKDQLDFMLDFNGWPGGYRCCLKRWTHDDRRMEFATLTYNGLYCFEPDTGPTRFGEREMVEQLVEEGWLVD